MPLSLLKNRKAANQSIKLFNHISPITHKTKKKLKMKTRTDYSIRIIILGFLLMVIYTLSSCSVSRGGNGMMHFSNGYGKGCVSNRFIGY